MQPIPWMCLENVDKSKSESDDTQNKWKKIKQIDFLDNVFTKTKLVSHSLYLCFFELHNTPTFKITDKTMKNIDQS